MKTIIGVRFKAAGKVYYFSPGDLSFEKGEFCVVETSRGIECGEVVMANREAEEGELTAPLKKVVRRATEADLKKTEENRQKEKEAFDICQRQIQKQKLDMSLVDVEYAFDGSKILFYFTADGRVDFRELVKELAGIFRSRIELRQIGVRDESKMMGGLGMCGRPFCCHSFMGDFQPVSIKMAKEQGLSLNPVKISGTCGRLMCCLNYEQTAYEYYWKETPSLGSLVETPDGVGSVADVNVLGRTVKVKFVKDDDAISYKSYTVQQVKLVRGSMGQRDKKNSKSEKQAEENSQIDL